MKVLSLFDGMSCCRLALEKLDVSVEKYYASEIDKYAIEVTQANYPDTEQLGDVTAWESWELDWASIDLVTGGFPCQAWSLAGKQLGDKDERGKLFWTMLEVMAKVMEHNPKAFYLMENVKMKKEFESYITHHTEQALPNVYKYLINSALVSAQSRQRCYWTNIPGVEQPEDRGIVLRDILEHEVGSEYQAGEHLQKNYQGGNQLNPSYKSQNNTIHDSNGKSATLAAGTHGYCNGYVAETKPKQVGKLVEKVKVRKHKVQVEALQELLLAKLKASGKSKKQIANELNDEFSTIEHYFRKVGSEFFSIPSAEHWPKLKKILKITSKKFDKQILEFEIKDGVYETKQRVYSDEGKAPTLTSGSADKLVETKPKQVGKVKDGGQGNRIYSTDGKSSTLSAQSGGTAGSGNTLIETKPKQVGIAADINGHDVLKRVYSPEGKSPTLNSMGGGNREPKVVSGALRARSKNQDGKNVGWKETKPEQMLELRKDEKANSVSSVSKDSLVVEKSHPIKANYYKSSRANFENDTSKGSKFSATGVQSEDLTWRKLTPLECERLQTVPDGYTAGVSNTQRYKMLGNGWTVDVIAHIFTFMQRAHNGEHLVTKGQQSLDF